jgi:hypothetical protein
MPRTGQRVSIRPGETLHDCSGAGARCRSALVPVGRMMPIFLLQLEGHAMKTSLHGTACTRLIFESLERRNLLTAVCQPVCTPAPPCAVDVWFAQQLQKCDKAPSSSAACVKTSSCDKAPATTCDKAPTCDKPAPRCEPKCEPKVCTTKPASAPCDKAPCTTTVTRCEAPKSACQTPPKQSCETAKPDCKTVDKCWTDCAWVNDLRAASCI